LIHQLKQFRRFVMVFSLFVVVVDSVAYGREQFFGQFRPHSSSHFRLGVVEPGAAFVARLVLDKDVMAVGGPFTGDYLTVSPSQLHEVVTERVGAFTQSRGPFCSVGHETLPQTIDDDAGDDKDDAFDDVKDSAHKGPSQGFVKALCYGLLLVLGVLLCEMYYLKKLIYRTLREHSNDLYYIKHDLSYLYGGLAIQTDSAREADAATSEEDDGK